MRKLPPQDLSFFELAPLRISDSVTIAASPLRVFAAFADAAGWPEWFPLMTRCEWVSDDRERVGAERRVSLRLLGNHQERFLAWEPGVRFAFTMVESDSPLATAIAEDYQLSAVRDGEATRLSWTLAAEPTTLGRIARPVLEAMMLRIVREAAKRLEARLTRR